MLRHSFALPAASYRPAATSPPGFPPGFPNLGSSPFAGLSLHMGLSRRAALFRASAAQHATAKSGGTKATRSAMPPDVTTGDVLAAALAEADAEHRRNPYEVLGWAGYPQHCSIAKGPAHGIKSSTGFSQKPLHSNGSFDSKLESSLSNSNVRFERLFRMLRKCKKMQKNAHNAGP